MKERRQLNIGCTRKQGEAIRKDKALFMETLKIKRMTMGDFVHTASLLALVHIGTHGYVEAYIDLSCEPNVICPWCKKVFVAVISRIKATAVALRCPLCSKDIVILIKEK